MTEKFSITPLSEYIKSEEGLSDKIDAILQEAN